MGRVSERALRLDAKVGRVVSTERIPRVGRVIDNELYVKRYLVETHLGSKS